MGPGLPVNFEGDRLPWDRGKSLETIRATYVRKKSSFIMTAFCIAKCDKKQRRIVDKTIVLLII